jgi:Sensors of blue-light using FAD
MALVHTIYCSVSTKLNFSAVELEQLLEVCRRNNGKADITGMLLYKSPWFFQILEGEPVALETLFEKIALDKRHKRIIKIVQEPIEARDFGEWSMGRADLSLKDLKRIPGLNDFFSKGTAWSELGEGRAKSLLEAFRSGQWRTSVS